MLDIPDYNSYAIECIEKIKVLQQKFKDDYDVDWYDNWFYNQTTGLLTFSTGDVELNFRYFNVGSFSQKSNTWKWSWDNNSILENVKNQTSTVKEFGENAAFSKLTTGCFPSDEYEAWEFVAIAATLTKGIGVYRPLNDNQLQIFLVVTEHLDNETAKKIKDKYVECEQHEFRRMAFVCKHLNLKNKVGFNEAFETYEAMELPEDDDFQAWCNECETVRQKEGEWNDASMEFAAIKIVCETCYFEMKEFNLGIEQTLSGKGPATIKSNSPKRYGLIKRFVKFIRRKSN